MALDLASITSHIHNCVLFLLWLHLFILSGVTSLLISSSILGTYRPGEFIYQCPIFLPFRVVCHSLLCEPHFCHNSPPWPVRLGWPYTAWLSFTELDKAVINAIRLASFLWLWYQSVCLLMPSVSTYCLTGVSPILDMGYLLTASAPDIGCGVSPLGHSLLQHRVASAHQKTLLHSWWNSILARLQLSPSYQYSCMDVRVGL